MYHLQGTARNSGEKMRNIRSFLADVSAPASEEIANAVCFLTTHVLQVVVQPRSKHCRKCDKCVQEFDHHCIWLNNCIGKANYGSFMCLLAGTLALLLFQAAVNAVLLASSFKNPAAAKNRQHHQFAGGISLTGYRIAWIAFLAAPLMLALLVGELLVFHLVLQWRGMSTYDYILAQREKHNSQRLPKAEPVDAPPSGSLITANDSALGPDGLDIEADKGPPHGLHHRIRLSPCAALSVPEEDASSKAAPAVELSRPESVVSMNSLLVAGTHSEHGGRTSERGMRRSRQENMLSSRPTTTGGDVSQSQELTNRQLIPAGYTAPSSRPTTAGDNGGQSQEPSEQQVIPAGMSISSSDTSLRQSQNLTERSSSAKASKSIMASVKGSIGLQASNRVQPLP